MRSNTKSYILYRTTLTFENIIKVVFLKIITCIFIMNNVCLLQTITTSNVCFPLIVRSKNKSFINIVRSSFLFMYFIFIDLYMLNVSYSRYKGNVSILNYSYLFCFFLYTYRDGDLFKFNF